MNSPHRRWQAEEAEFRATALRATRQLWLLRAQSALTLAGVVVAMVWLATWFPFGMQRSDYSPRVVSTLVLVTAVITAASALVVRWSILLREEPVSELWMTLAGHSMSVRSRSRFLRRLEFQCRVASTDRRRFFTLLVLQMAFPHGSSPGRPIDERLPAIREALRNGDIIGVAGPHEVWVLLDQASITAGKRIADRLKDVIEMSLESHTGERVLVLAGHSAFGDDGRDAAMLFECARRRIITSEVAPSDTGATVPLIVVGRDQKDSARARSA